MGRITKVDGFVVTVFPKEQGHNRAHVTVIKDGKSAVFFLDTEPPTPGPRSKDMKRQEWNKAFELACKHYSESVDEWSELHG